MSERGYLDGVPLRLNSKFYPQPRPQFKEIDIHIPVDALQDEYDFSMERRTLMEVEAWEEQYRLDQERRALKVKQEEEARLHIEEERRRLDEEERVRRAEEQIKRLEEEEKERVIRRAEEQIKQLEEEEEKEQCSEEQISRLADEERGRRAEDEIKRLEEQERVRRAEEEDVRLAFSQPPSQWSQNYYVPASAPDITGRDNNITATPTTTCQTNIQPTSSVNSFKKYYFPLLTSMADSRSMRDRQNQFSSNLNQTYNSLHSSSNQVSNQHPYLCANPPPPPVQQFPILGSLSQQQPSNHLWPGGTGVISPMSYSTVNNPVLNGPLVHDSVLKPNSGSLPSPDNLTTNTPSNGTHHHTLL